jgi:AcrR family transcriptional regulator
VQRFIWQVAPDVKFGIQCCAVKRRYELKKRAERQRETRLRIVEAAVALHGTVGPARTTISAIAERAGVQRHTVYSHFAEERDLYLACSGLHLSRHPLPDPEPLLAVDDREERLRRGLDELYAYFEANEGLLANVVRDMEVHELTRDVAELRIAPTLARLREVLAAPFPARGRRRARLEGAVAVAVDFRTWQTLVRRSGLSPQEAIEVALGMVRCA